MNTKIALEGGWIGQINKSENLLQVNKNGGRTQWFKEFRFSTILRLHLTYYQVRIFNKPILFTRLYKSFMAHSYNHTNKSF